MDYYLLFLLIGIFNCSKLMGFFYFEISKVCVCFLFVSDMTQGRWGGFGSRTQGFWAWTVSFDKPGTFLMDLRGWLSCGNQSFVCTHRAFYPKNHMFF